MAVQFTYVPIATQTLGAANSTVTFSSIPSTYQDLVLDVSPFTTAAGGIDINMTFNGDSGTNYSRTYLTGNGTSSSSNRSNGASYIRLTASGFASNNSAPAVTLANIMNYANTNTYKTTLNRSSSGTNGTDVVVGLWRSTAAITSITLSSSGGNFEVNSTFTLYGLAAA
jgi:hypothetical protein